MDTIYKNLDIFQIQENSQSRQKFHNKLVCVFTAKQKCGLKSTTTNGWRHFGQSEQHKSSICFPSQSERSPDSGLFCMCSVKELYHALLPKTDLTEIKGEGMIAGYCHININDSPIVLYTVLKLIHVI